MLFDDVSGAAGSWLVNEPLTVFPEMANSEDGRVLGEI